MLVQVPEVITTGYKWLRAVAKGEFTGVHTDRVFLGRGSSRVLTAWLPLGKVCTPTSSVENSTQRIRQVCHMLSANNPSALHCIARINCQFVHPHRLLRHTCHALWVVYHMTLRC